MTTSVDAVAEREGLERAEVVRIFEQAILEAARHAWGPTRTLEASFDEGKQAVEVQHVFVVAEAVDDPRKQVPLARVGAMGFEAGDEMLCSVFYRDEEVESARMQCRENPELPTFDLLAAGLPMPEEPRWLRDLWPVRRKAWRWGLPIETPEFGEALDRLESWLRSVAPPEVVAALGPAADADLAVLRARVVHFDRDAPEIVVEAPSFAAWIGLLAVCAEAGVLEWDDEIRYDMSAYRELQKIVCGSYPRPLDP